MSITIDPSRIFTRKQVDDLLTATIGKTLLEVDKAKLFAHHEGRDNKITLHNKEVPKVIAVISPEFSQRIPVVSHIVGDSNSAVPLVVFKPTGNTRRRFQLNAGIGLEHADNFLCSGSKEHLSSANSFFLHSFSNLKWLLMLSSLSSTNGLRTSSETLIQSTNHSYSSRSSHQRLSFSNHTLANVWTAGYHQGSACTDVRCLGHSSTLRASAPS